MSTRVLVTASSRGIGRAIAVRLANEGWSVAIHYAADSKDAQSVQRVLGKRCSGMYQADLSQPANASKLVSEALKEGPLDALVNNAGVYLPLDFLGSGEASFNANMHRTFAV